LKANICAPTDLFHRFQLSMGTRTVTQEIFDWNETMKTASKARLFRDGHRGHSQFWIE